MWQGGVASEGVVSTMWAKTMVGRIELGEKWGRKGEKVKFDKTKKESFEEREYTKGV